MNEKDLDRAVDELDRMSANVADDIVQVLTLRPNVTAVAALKGMSMALGAAIAMSIRNAGFDPPDDLIIATARRVADRALAAFDAELGPMLDPEDDYRL